MKVDGPKRINTPQIMIRTISNLIGERDERPI